jgi:AraC-like DNA-binding protein
MLRNLDSQKTSDYRFNYELPQGLPLAVRSVGEYQLSPNSQIERPVRKWFSEIFWSVKGCGEFRLGNRRYEVRGCSVFYLLPGEVHDVRPLSQRWKFHWFTLDHGQSPLWLEAFGLTHRPFTVLRFPSDLFRNLRLAVRKGTRRGDQEAAHCAHAILLAAMEGNREPSVRLPASWVENCRHRIDLGFADPEINITAIAQEIGVHRATLFRAFLAEYGMTPSRYLQSLRLRKAMELLKSSDAPIKQIAADSGIKDPNYFARLFQKVSGRVPSMFRAAYRRTAL